MSLENFSLNQLRDSVLSGETRREQWRRDQLESLSDLLERTALVIAEQQGHNDIVELLK